MPPTNPSSWLRSTLLRPRRTGILLSRPSTIITTTRRGYSSTNDPDKLPKAPTGEKGPNMGQQEHVSEEAAKMAKIQGKEGPDVEAGTPVQEILQEEKDTRKNAPQVLKEEAKKGAQGGSGGGGGGGGGQQTRQFSTMVRRMAEMEISSSSGGMDQVPLDPSMVLSASQRAEYQTLESTTTTDVQQQGHKYPLPSLPLPATSRLRNRHDPVVTQLTNLMMRDGKKAQAEKNMSVILNHLRTAPAPTFNPSRPLLPGHPPASHLPLTPIIYLTLAVDSVAPLLRIRSQRGAAGGGVALQIPVPLGVRQRRRQAFQWILDAATKKKNSPETFAQRVAGEVIAVVEGRSGVWEKRTAVHRLGTTARTNLGFGNRGRRR